MSSSTRSRRQRQTTLSSRNNKENTPQGEKKSMKKTSKSKVKGLATLQIDANDATLLVGGTKTPAKQKQSKKSLNSSNPVSPLLPEIPLIINKDGSFEIEKVSQSVACTQTETLTLNDKSTQTTPAEKTKEEQQSLDYRMVACEEPPLEYYQILAEQRRLALVDTIRENEKLHEEIEFLMTQVKENEKHQNDALYFQFMYRLASNDTH